MARHCVTGQTVSFGRALLRDARLICELSDAKFISISQVNLALLSKSLGVELSAVEFMAEDRFSKLLLDE